MSSTVSRIMKAFRSLIGRVGNPVQQNSSPVVKAAENFTRKQDEIKESQKDYQYSIKPKVDHATTTEAKFETVVGDIVKDQHGTNGVQSKEAEKSRVEIASRQSKSEDQCSKSISETDFATINNRDVLKAPKVAAVEETPRTTVLEALTEKLNVEPLKPELSSQEDTFKSDESFKEMEKLSMLSQNESVNTEALLKADESSDVEKLQILASAIVNVEENDTTQLNQSSSHPNKSLSTCNKTNIGSFDTLKSIRPHIPLIRFRKGGLSPKALEHQPSLEQAQPAETDPASFIGLANEDAFMRETIKPQPASNAFEWWETPLRFKRRNIDDKECDAINSGGCDQIFN